MVDGYTFKGPFALKQRVRIKEPGIIGTIIEIRLKPDSPLIYVVEIWEDGEVKDYAMYGWQLEKVKNNSIGIKGA